MARDNGLARLNRRLAAIPKSVRQAVQPALAKGAQEIMAAQEALAPVDDGTLRRSIRTEPGRHELAITITAGGPTTTRPVREGSTASYDYALANEHGTADMAAQPFFFPGYRLARKKAQARIKRAMGKAVRQAWGGG
jgi:HK97 gp10 family phage protein